MRVKGGEGAKRTREGQELEESRMRAGIKHVMKGRKSACWSYDSHACPLCVCHSGTEKRTENSSPRRRSAVTGLAQRMWGGGKQKPSQSDEVYFQLFCLSITGGTKDLFCCFLVCFFLCFAVVVWFLGEWISVSHYALNGVHSTEAENISETRTPRLSEEACSVRGACSLKSKLQKNGLGGCSGETVLTEQNARVVSSSKLVCC